MKLLFFLPLALFTYSLMAQPISGALVYQHILTLDLKGQNLPENLAAVIPKEQQYEKVLYFSSEASLYENSEGASVTKEPDYGEENIAIRAEISKSDDRIYTNFKDRKITEQKELMGRFFLITRDMKPLKWKLTGRQKKILDRACMEAVAAEGDSVVAWYTTEIPVASGPEYLSGLPGMILEADVGSLLHIKAVRFDQGNDVGKVKLKEPSKGKRIDAVDFEKLEKEKIAEMQKQYGGNGNVIILNGSGR